MFKTSSRNMTNTFCFVVWTEMANTDFFGKEVISKIFYYISSINGELK